MHLSTTFIRRTLYQQCGGFNTSLRYCAEAELYLKLAALGQIWLLECYHRRAT